MSQRAFVCRRVVRDGAISESFVESCRRGPVGSKSETSVTILRARLESVDQHATNPSGAKLWPDEHVTNSTNACVIDVWIRRHASERDKVALLEDATEVLARRVELNAAICTFVSEARDEPEALSLSDSRQISNDRQVGGCEGSCFQS